MAAWRGATAAWKEEDEEVVDSWYPEDVIDDIIEEEEDDLVSLPASTRNTPQPQGPQILLFTESEKDLSAAQNIMQQTRAMYYLGDEAGAAGGIAPPSSLATGRYQQTEDDSPALQFITMDELINIQDMCGHLGAANQSKHSIKTKMDPKSQHTNIFKQLHRQSSTKSLIHNRGGNTSALSQQAYRVSVQANQAVDTFFDERGELSDADTEAEDEEPGMSLTLPSKRGSARQKEPKEDTRSPLQRFKEAMGYESSDEEDKDVDKLAEKLRNGVNTNEGTDLHVKGKNETEGWLPKSTLLKAMEWSKKKMEKPAAEDEEDEEVEMTSRLPLFLQLDDDNDEEEDGATQEQRQKKLVREIKEELDFELPMSIRLALIDTAIPIVEGTIKEYLKVLGPNHSMTEEAVDRLAELKSQRALYV